MVRPQHLILSVPREIRLHIPLTTSSRDQVKTGSACHDVGLRYPFAMSRPRWNSALDDFFRTPWHYYFEDEITRLSTILLEYGFQEWSKAPRLYIVLRGIGRQHLISAFMKNGIDDNRLPLDSLTLELAIPSLDPAMIEEFVDYQQKVVRHEKSVYDTCIRTYLAPEHDLLKDPLDDVDFHQISRLLLFCGEKEAARTPKLYYVLRSICHLDKLPLFHAANYDDMWFPFSRSHIILPNFFENGLAIQSFMQNQMHVCSSRWSEDVHLNFLDEEHNHLKTIKRLGSGGSGTVDHVWCPSSRKNYARKIVVRSFEGFRILANEIKMLKAVSHRHCVSLTGSYTDTRVVALLSEPVADMNLSTFLDTDPLSQDRKQLLQTSFGCLSSALTYLHQKGIWHKDIKPQNILIHGNNILLTDFGC